MELPDPDLSIPELSRAARLAARTSFGVNPDRIRTLAEMSWTDSIDWILDHGRQQVDDYANVGAGPPDTTDLEAILGWWIDTMIDPNSGLMDRLNWFWHTVLTTDEEQTKADLVGQQIHLLRGHGVGNFRNLVQRFVIDGALLQFLDADGSAFYNPNENLARELMELFTLGRGHYTQADVEVAARALSGWSVEDGVVVFNPEDGPDTEIVEEFRGTQSVWDNTTIVDSLCDDPQTAVRISSLMWSHFVGSELDSREALKLGQWWQEQDLEILDLIRRILHSNEFEQAVKWDAVNSRPKSGFEWWASLVTATKSSSANIYDLDYLGQIPYGPPNVGGWSTGNHWIATGSMLVKTSTILNLDNLSDIGPEPFSVQSVLAECGLFEVSDATSEALEVGFSMTNLDSETKRKLVWRIALCCPEFSQL